MTRKAFGASVLKSSRAHLTVLTELAAEGHGEVGGCARPAVVAKEVLVVVKGSASPFTDLHILKTGLYTVQRKRNEQQKKNKKHFY